MSVDIVKGKYEAIEEKTKKVIKSYERTSYSKASSLFISGVAAAVMYGGFKTGNWIHGITGLALLGSGVISYYNICTSERMAIKDEMKELIKEEISSLEKKLSEKTDLN